MVKRRRSAPRSPRTKILSLAGARRALARARRAGRRIVFTNGVFDLLHPGHLALLWKARSLGDLLVVAFNSDASVRRLKGKDRPFVRQQDRALMLAALEAVDYVVMYEDDTPHAVIAALAPDVLVKGGDWAAGAIVGRDIVEAGGGRVVRVRTIAGRSTTRLAERIVKHQRR